MPLSKPQRRISFTTIATFGVSLFVALAVGITLYMSGIAGVRSTQDLLAERAGGLMDRLESRVDAKLQPVIVQGDWIVQAIESGRIKIGDIPQLDNFMFGALATTPQVRNLALIQPDGSVRRWHRNRSAAFDEDWSKREILPVLLERARTQENPEWRTPLTSTTSYSAVLQRSAPLRIDGRFVGILSQVIPAYRLSREMDAFGSESGVIPFILYDKDRVLAHPSLRGDEVQSTDQPLISIASLGDPRLARIWNPDSVDPFGMKTLKGATAVAATIDGERYVYLYRELRGYRPYQLTVGAYIHVAGSGAAQPMRRVMRSVLAGLGVLLIAVVFAAVAGSRLSAPIRKLAQASATAQAGRLDEVPRLRHSVIREFDDAAQSFNAMVDGLRERILIRNTLGRFVSEEVARGLLSGNGELEPVEATATALICDLEGFTPLTDSLGPRRVVELLNAYFQVMADIIGRHGGVITQFQGDAVLAVFNLPIPLGDHAGRAVDAAAEMVRAADEQEFAGVRLRNRIGIATGTLLAGAVGSQGRSNYTVHGNTVNLASRIEGLNRTYGTRILLVQSTADQCTRTRLRRVDDAEIRGYSKRVVLYTPESQ